MELSNERGWYSPGGHADFWGRSGTYQWIADALLPPIDHGQLDESFAWLPPAKDGDTVLGFETPYKRNFSRATTDAQQQNLRIPPSLIRFLTTPDLHGRVQSCTACYLDLSWGLLAAPDGGRLLRFLNDQQAVLLWYLHLRLDGTHQVLVGDPEWHEHAPPGAKTLDEQIDPGLLRPCAKSIEAFLYRFWIENAIWYGLHEQRPLTPAQEDYRQAALRNRDQRP